MVHLTQSFMDVSSDKEAEKFHITVKYLILIRSKIYITCKYNKEIFMLSISQTNKMFKFPYFKYFHLCSVEHCSTIFSYVPALLDIFQTDLDAPQSRMDEEQQLSPAH